VTDGTDTNTMIDRARPHRPARRSPLIGAAAYLANPGHAAVQIGGSARARHRNTQLRCATSIGLSDMAASTRAVAQLTPVLDRTYPMADTTQALRYVEGGHAHGKVVITMA
jgi:NADPH:quinone reductase-like Zn-dependent oxidoreductase